MAVKKAKSKVVDTSIDNRVTALSVKGGDMSSEYVYSANGENIVVRIKSHIPLSEQALMAADIADMQYLDDTYTPFMSKFASVFYIYKYYTDLNFDGFSVDDLDYVVRNKDFYGFVVSHIDDNLNDIIDNADNLVYWKQQTIFNHSKAEDLYDLLIMFVDKASHILDSIGKNIKSDEDIDLKELLSIFKAPFGEESYKQDIAKKIIEVKDLNYAKKKGTRKRTVPQVKEDNGEGVPAPTDGDMKDD